MFSKKSAKRTSIRRMILSLSCIRARRGTGMSLLSEPRAVATGSWALPIAHYLVAEFNRQSLIGNRQSDTTPTRTSAIA